jgi:hypothetical protein
VCGSEDVSVVDQHATAVEAIEVRKAGHPWVFVHLCGLATHNPAAIIALATTYNNYQIILERL